MVANTNISPVFIPIEILHGRKSEEGFGELVEVAMGLPLPYSKVMSKEESGVFKKVSNKSDSTVTDSSKILIECLLDCLLVHLFHHLLEPLFHHLLHRLFRRLFDNL